MSTGERNRCHHGVPLRKVGNTVANAIDPSRDLMAEYDGRKRGVTHQEVRMTQPAIRDTNENLARPRRSHLDVVDELDLGPGCFADHRLHVYSLSRKAAAFEGGRYTAGYGCGSFGVTPSLASRNADLVVVLGYIERLSRRV
jgi:hypothetical protein